MSHAIVRRLGAGLTLALFVGVAAPAFAAEAAVDAAPMQGKKIRLDGLLEEWPRPQRLGQTLSGGTTRVEGVAAYDDDHLYVAMRVEDANLVRSGSMGTNEDHGMLMLAFPSGAGFRSYEVKLYPGVPGKSAGSVKLAGKGAVAGAEIVEAPFDGGLSFEARIPWAAFPEAKRVRSGLRGALRYKDVDPGGKSSVVGTSKADGAGLPPFTIEAEFGLQRSLVSAKGLKPRPDRLLAGNLVGDGMYETVALYERYLAVTGFHYRGGSEFFYQDLNLAPSGLERFDLDDVDGDGKQELVLQRRVGSSGDAKDYFEVWKFRSEAGPPELLFQHEVGFTKGSARVHNEVKVETRKGTWGVRVGQGKTEGLEPAEWDGPTISGERATLMPWETVLSRRYEFDSGSFRMVEEKEWEPKMVSPTGSRARSGRAAGDPLPQESERRAPAARPPNPEELLDGVYSLYRTDRGVKKSKPRFDFVTDVAADETTERVLVHGKDIVVFGQKFKQGTSYVYTTIGVKEPEHVLSVTARDVTGDGRAEIIVRGIIPVQASKQLGGEVVTRHALMIYRVSEEGITRIFAAETGRSLKENSIQGRISFVPVSNAMKIELHPGFSVGWTEKTYPFPADTRPYQGLEPLLLPWTDLGSRAYVYGSGGYRLVE